MSSLSALAALCALFLATHFAFSHPPVRSALIARLGPRGFDAGYSALSLALYLPAAWLWFRSGHQGALLWAPRLPWLAQILAASGVALAVAGVVRPAPSSHFRSSAGAVRGIQHVTRHPLFVGVALVCAGHLLVSGWAGDAWFLGTNVVLGTLGSWHQDARMRASRPGYREFEASTTLLPNPLGLARIDGRTAAVLAAGLALAVAIRWAHRLW